MLRVSCPLVSLVWPRATASQQTRHQPDLQWLKFQNPCTLPNMWHLLCMHDSLHTTLPLLLFQWKCWKRKRFRAVHGDKTTMGARTRIRNETIASSGYCSGTDWNLNLPYSSSIWCVLTVVFASEAYPIVCPLAESAFAHRHARVVALHSHIPDYLKCRKNQSIESVCPSRVWDC